MCPRPARIELLILGLLVFFRMRYGERMDLDGMAPAVESTKPAIVVKPHAQKQQLVPYGC